MEKQTNQIHDEEKKEQTQSVQNKAEKPELTEAEAKQVTGGAYRVIT